MKEQVPASHQLAALARHTPLLTSGIDGMAADGAFLVLLEPFLAAREVELVLAGQGHNF